MGWLYHEESRVSADQFLAEATNCSHWHGLVQNLNFGFICFIFLWKGTGLLENILKTILWFNITRNPELFLGYERKRPLNFARDVFSVSRPFFRRAVQFEVHFSFLCSHWRLIVLQSFYSEDKMLPWSDLVYWHYVTCMKTVVWEGLCNLLLSLPSEP